MYLITKWFGVFLCNKKEIKEKILFPKKEKEISKRLIKINNNEIISEEIEISKGIKNLIVNEKRLEKLGSYEPSNPFFANFDIKSEDFNYLIDLLHKSSIISTETKTSKKLESEDLQIIQMINTLDDLIQTSNLLSERLEAWSVLPKIEENINPLKQAFSTVNTQINVLEQKIKKNMKVTAPNISCVVGEIIGARLISCAGSLEKLAFFPASTIQILGAEKALFRFKKQGGRPPKHGVIFQNTKIKDAKRDQRGKIARSLASKLSIAAKADAFTKRNISEELIKDFENRVKEIKNS
jgi:nucleolar protein 56